ncbi:hypothetical protein CC2G_009633 [Coprinopsis cinerea AmutBmut pab1-1]|nr:hypothetical protein CC2G_009633 [Coprinopsis cinerea AmutBmut pab1-1]
MNPASRPRLQIIAFKALSVRIPIHLSPESIPLSHVAASSNSNPRRRPAPRFTSAIDGTRSSARMQRGHWQGIGKIDMERGARKEVLFHQFVGLYLPHTVYCVW